MKSHQTADYRERYEPQAESEHGPDHDLETYYSPDEREEICLTNREREDFESCTDLSLDADVLTEKQFTALLSYVTDDCDIETFTFPDRTN